MMVLDYKTKTSIAPLTYNHSYSMHKDTKVNKTIIIFFSPVLVQCIIMLKCEE